MTRFERPVRQAVLLSAPEMLLTYPREGEGRDGSGSDEGVGNGFDNGSPRAYAERWFTTADDPAAVQEWFRDQLTNLGWTMTRDRPTFHVYQREEDESIGVAVFESGVRAHFEVAGTWPDGSSDYRPN